jgi:hypothetical protein
MTIDPATALLVPSLAEYRRLRRKINRAEKWVDSIRGRNGWASYRPEDAPSYVNHVNNDMRQQVELFELYRDKPAQLTAYAVAGGKITTWPGAVIGHYRESASWRDCHNNRVRQLRVTLPGIGRYTGRNSGDGMYINLRAISN